MKELLLITAFVCCLLHGTSCARTVDTTIDVGNGHRLHFTIIKGKEAPILFESGFGNGADVWKDITKQIADITGATIITYDRLSYSEQPQNYQISFETEIKALETGLQKLGYANKSIMLVAHSLGGTYTTYYTSRHPTEVKAEVLIECPNACSLKSHFKISTIDPNDAVEKYLSNITDTIIKHPIPLNIPLIDIVSVGHTDDDGRLDTVWLDCHKDFASKSPMRKYFLAYGVGHAVHAENPQLVINAIITQYASYLIPERKAAILEKGYASTFDMLNESKKNEIKCGHSEDDITTWGYSYLEKGETEKAIEVFKLNVALNPNGWNTYDCLGEAYLKAGNKKLAIENYTRSLELNPKNDNAVKILEQIH
jgi:tetratricopeptide (TPR) repeat protein